MAAEYIAIPWEGGARTLGHRPIEAPAGLAFRGFGIYVGLDQNTTEAAGIDLGAVIRQVENVLTALPRTETFTSLVLAPEGEPTPPLDAVRAALGEPTAQQDPAPTSPKTSGLVVDLARNRVSIDGSPVHLSYREQALLTYLVEHQGELHDRRALLTALATADGSEEIGERTIDVYLQRLRRRLAPYAEVIRTVRGRGYRLDPHPDVTVIGAAPATS